jgi:hypothetical protein
MTIYIQNVGVTESPLVMPPSLEEPQRRPKPITNAEGLTPEGLEVLPLPSMDDYLEKK